MEVSAHDRRLDARQRLSSLLQQGGRIDLVHAAFLIALEEYPDLDVARETARVRILSLQGAQQVEGLTNPFQRLDGLRRYLFDELGYRGNFHHYSDPRNSYLNEVLNRRLGIPLTLSILFMETARAAGFDARGVGLPGHFVTRLSLDGRTVFVDPFHSARVINEDDCRQLVTQTTGHPSLFRRELLDGADDRSMVSRMLLNLKHIYVNREDYGRALRAVERLLLVHPGEPSEVRDRGLLQANLGCPGAAVADLGTYLAERPDAPDAPAVQARLVLLMRQVSELN